MRILLIGGNGFIGRFVVSALKQQGHALAVFHRGTKAVPAGVDEIRGDRNRLNASAQELKRFVTESSCRGFVMAQEVDLWMVHFDV